MDSRYGTNVDFEVFPSNLGYALLFFPFPRGWGRTTCLSRMPLRRSLAPIAFCGRIMQPFLLLPLLGSSTKGEGPTGSATMASAVFPFSFRRPRIPPFVAVQRIISALGKEGGVVVVHFSGTRKSLCLFLLKLGGRPLLFFFSLIDP